MKIKCTTHPKTSKNITINNEYDVDVLPSSFSEDNYVEIINDAGIKCKYRAHLFLPAQTEEEIYLAWRRRFSIDITSDSDESFYRVNNTDSTNRFYYYTADISCGITYVSGVEGLCRFLSDRISSYLSESNSNVSFVDRLIEEDLSYLNIPDTLTDNLQGAFALLTTYLPETLTTILNSNSPYNYVKTKVILYLDEVSLEESPAMERKRTSTSSGNDIVIWTLPI